jgi:hypothetical protein
MGLFEYESEAEWDRQVIKGFGKEPPADG